MPEIRSARYVIAVPDLASSAVFYEGVLGFTVRETGDPGWRFFEKDACLILAGECPHAIPPRDLGDHSYFAYLVTTDVDDLYASVRKKGAEIVKSLRDEPWGMREFGLRTGDGHRIMFAARILPR